MEEKQLNFNQPLLSVRRFSSTLSSEADNKRKIDNSSARLPVYKSGSAPLRNVGTVPFVWEQIPGRPKDEIKLQTQNVEQRLPIIPKLPPGRVSKVRLQDSDKVVSEGTSSVTQSITGEVVSNSQNDTSMDKDVIKHERPKEAIQEKASSGSDDGHEAFVDALDTLSRTESFFMNCSVSGLSGLDDQNFQPFGSFSADQLARDFMIGRFLPAAKAMASETPHYAPRKPPVARELSLPKPDWPKIIARPEPRLLKNAASIEIQHRPRALPQYVQDISQSESEDEGDNYNGSQSYAPKVCGLLPCFCLLNPIPGLRMQNRVLFSSVHDLQAKSSASHSGTGKEHARTAHHVKKLVESKSKNGVHPHSKDSSKLSAYESARCESRCAKPVAEKTLYIDSVHKAKSHSNSDCSEIKGQTDLRGHHSETSNKDSDIHKNPLIDPSLQYGKHLGIVDEKATSQNKSSESLDSLLRSRSDRCNYDMKLEMTNHSKKTDTENERLMKSANQVDDLDLDSFLTSSPHVVKCKNIDSESQVKNSVSWRSSKLGGEVQIDFKNQLPTKSVDQECTLGLTQDPSTLASSKVVGDGKVDIKRKWLMKLDGQESTDTNNLKLPLALPSPNPPAESWLKRTLPTIYSKNTSPRPSLAARIHLQNQLARQHHLIQMGNNN